MLALLSRIVMQLAAIRWLFKLGGLGLLVPVALLLKAIGLPVLIVLAILALPILIILFLFGLPIFAVLALGGAIVGILGFLMTAVMVVVKIALFVVLPVWVVCKIGKALFTWLSRKRGDTGGDVTPDAPPVTPVDAMPTSE